MTRVRGLKYAALALTVATSFGMIGGCANDLLVATYTGWINSLVSQILPLSVRVVQ